MDQGSTFGAWLKGRRRARDLSREALAELASCAPPTLAKLEQGTRRPSRELAVLLVDALRTPHAEREHALQLARLPLAEGAPLSRPPSPAKDADDLRLGNSLPTALSSLIGRGAELRELRERLRDPACRVLTLAGHGGVGKTRLALELAGTVRGQFRDGAAWVELAAVADADGVAPAIAEAVACSQRGPEPLGARLLAFLRERQLLLVLDNAEHLPGATPFLASIVRHAPEVTLLLTSRRPLGLPGEWIVAVDGLPAPAAGAAPDLERYDATLLFLERARQAGAGEVLGRERRQAVAQICQLLGGVPLAIELAAAWTRTLSVGEIAAELARSPLLLAAPGGTASGRHRSMRAVFEQSWALLDNDQRHALATLSIFQGGFTREAAERVAGVSLAVLAALLDLSLLRRREVDGQSRYLIHELVRQYAVERLSPEADAKARAAHALFFTTFLAVSAPRLQGGDQLAALALLDQERTNSVQAWAWAAEAGDEAALLRAAPGLLLMHELRGRLRESAALLAGAAARRRMARPRGGPAGNDRALGVLCAWEGWARGRYGEIAASYELLVEAVALLDGDDDMLATTGALGSLGLLLLQRGQYAEARLALERSISLVVPRNLLFFATLHTVFLLNVRLAEGDLEGAAALGALAIERGDAGGGQRARLLGRCGAALVSNLTGASGQARELARSALALAADAKDPFGLGLALLMLGIAARSSGDLEEARYLLAESVEACAAVGDRWNQGRGLVQLGVALRAMEEDHAARTAWREALRLSLEHGINGVAASAAVELAALAADSGSLPAVRLLAALAARPETDALARARCAALLAGSGHDSRGALHQGIAGTGETRPLGELLVMYPSIYGFILPSWLNLHRIC